MEYPNVIDNKQVDTITNSKAKAKSENGCQRERNKKQSTNTTKKPYSFDELYRIRNSMKSFNAISFDNMDTLLKKSAEKVPAKRSNERKHGKQFENNCERPKRANDRDRVTKEQNRIILGPQRRSFNSGCFVPVSTTNCATTASNNQNPFNSTTTVSSNSTSTSITTTSSRSNTSRRIGSGRMFCAESDSNAIQFEANSQSVASSNSNSGNTNPNHRSKSTNSVSDDKHDKRVFARDFEKQSNRAGGSTASNRYGTHNPNQDWRSGGKESHRNRYGVEDEPEWFSCGPTSQFDTIELKGFDDSSEEHPIECDTMTTEYQKENGGSTVCAVAVPVANTDSTVIPPSETDVINTPDLEGDDGVCQDESGDVVHKVLSILQCDSVSELLKINSVDDKGEKHTGSKFSKWFQTKPNNRNIHNTIVTEPNATYPPNCVPEKSVVHGGDHNNVGNQESFPYRNSSWGDNLVNDILNENNADELMAKKLTPNDIIEFVKVDLKSDDKIREVNSKAIPLEELERKIRSGLQSRNENCDTVMGYSHDNNMASSLQQPRINVPHVPTDLVMKLHHIQQHQEMMSMMHQQNLIQNIDTSSTVPALSGAFSSTSSHQQLLNEIYDCPEASSVFFGLKNGVISMESIYHHLSYSNLNRNYRDMLISILRVHNAQQQKNDDLMHNFQQVQHHQQHGRQSNSTHMSQNLLHKKMLIKKADDQMQQQQQHQQQQQQHQKQQYQQSANYYQHQPHLMTSSGNANKNLAFTPTSVLRKMVADKDSDSVLSSPLLSRSNTPTIDKLKEGPNMFSSIVGDKSSSYAPFATTVSTTHVTRLPSTDHSNNDVHGNPFYNQWSNSNREVHSQHYPEPYNKVLDHQMIRNHNNAQLPIGNPPIGNPTTSSSMIFENLLQLRQPLSQTPSSSQQYQNPNYYPNVSHHRQHQVPPPHHQNPSVLAQQQSMFLTRNFHNT